MDLFVFFFSSHFWRLIKSVVCMLVYSSSSLGFLFQSFWGFFPVVFFGGLFLFIPLLFPSFFLFLFFLSLFALGKNQLTWRLPTRLLLLRLLLRIGCWAAPVVVVVAAASAVRVLGTGVGVLALHQDAALPGALPGLSCV